MIINCVEQNFKTINCLIPCSVSNGPSSGNGPSSSEGASSSQPNERNSCNSPDSSSNANKTAGKHQSNTRNKIFKFHFFVLFNKQFDFPNSDDESKNQKETSPSSSLVNI